MVRWLGVSRVRGQFVGVANSTTANRLVGKPFCRCEKLSNLEKLCSGRVWVDVWFAGSLARGVVGSRANVAESLGVAD